MTMYRFAGRAAGSVLSMVVLAIGFMFLVADPAGADPAGPTDYRTEVTGIDPAIGGFDFAVIGGDSFVELTVAPGVEVVVIGYRGEEYLRFDGDGTVHQNERSPTRWLNEDRFGEGEIPADADPTAEPAWTQVADDGQFAWHDHRSHWMNEARPPAASPGSVILEAVIPIVVSGTAVEIGVKSTWIAGPNTALPIAVAFAAGGAVVAMAARRKPVMVVGVAALAVAVLALVLGVVAYRSVPAETGASLLLWLLPLVSVLAGAAALGLSAKRPFAAASCAAVAALELVVWGWLRREAVVRAIIPSEAPASLDRIGVAAAIVVGCVCTVAAVLAAATPAPPPPTPEPTR
jgi:hypothetical protein